MDVRSLTWVGLSFGVGLPYLWGTSMIIQVDEEGREAVQMLCNLARKVVPLDDLGVIVTIKDSITDIKTKEDDDGST